MRALRDRLNEAALYALIDGGESPMAFADLSEQLVAAGVDVLQLRDKTLGDRLLVQRARLLREQTRNSNTLFVMNDRPDIAVLSDADGVHVGQDDLSVADVRAIVGPDRLVGVSTHTLDQALAAAAESADYIGVGPVFPSSTKRFDEFPGLELLRLTRVKVTLPMFAIGGITIENVQQVLDAGFHRIAVSGAITKAAEPALAARRLLELLKPAGNRK